MKKLILSVFLIVLIANIAISQPKFANTLTGISSQYGLDGSSVFKLDANGNSVWVKDFAGQIVPSTFSNLLYGLAFDGNNLYLLEMQGFNGSGIPPTMNAAIIKMDTLGNVQFIKYNTIQSPGGYEVMDIYPSFDNGAWIIDNYSSGITQSGRVYKIDSSGNLHSIIAIWYGSVARTKKISLLPDSTYVVCSDHRASTGGMDVPYSALINFDENGSVIWKYSYQIVNGLIGESLSFQDMITDNSGYIYLFENYYGSTPGTVLIKLNYSGSVVNSKLFPDINVYTISDLRFENNGIIATYNNEEIHIDTSLSNSCLNSQNFPVYSDNNSVPIFPNYFFSSTTFSPANGAAYSYTPGSLSDYCSTSSININPDETNTFAIYPNPANDHFSLIGEFRGKTVLEIENLQGQLISRKNISATNMIDISELRNGIYFIKISNENIQERNKLIVEH